MNLQKEEKRKQRIKYLVAFMVLLCVEILIAVYVNDAFIRPYLGDILVVIVLYCAVRVIVLDKFRLMPLWIFVFAAFVECLQYFKLVQVLGLQDSRFWRILIGSTFDLKDITCYGIGAIILGMYEWLLRRNKRHKL